MERGGKEAFRALTGELGRLLLFPLPSSSFLAGETRTDLHLACNMTRSALLRPTCSFLQLFTSSWSSYSSLPFFNEEDRGGGISSTPISEFICTWCCWLSWYICCFSCCRCFFLCRCSCCLLLFRSLLLLLLLEDILLGRRQCQPCSLSGRHSWQDQILKNRF